MLEETEFQPMWDACEGALGGKKVALFGSYGWGDGEWMRSWEDACGSAGAVLACESVICNEAPNEEALEACRALGGADERTGESGAGSSLSDCYVDER